MKNISCIAIDDEPMALLVIEQFCQRRGGIELTTYSEPQNGIDEIIRTKPQLVFLDIHMSSINGLDIARSIPHETCIIFTTAHAQYALEGFNLDAVDYLHKPFAYERFCRAVDKAMRRINTTSVNQQRHITVKQEYSNVNILLNDIFYIEALGLCKNCQSHRRKCTYTYKHENTNADASTRNICEDSSFIHRSVE